MVIVLVAAATAIMAADETFHGLVQSPDELVTQFLGVPHHSYILTHLYTLLHRVQGISRNYAQKLRREFQAPTPKIQESPSVFSKGWPEIKKLGRHIQKHLPSSPYSMAMHF